MEEYNKTKYKINDIWQTNERKPEKESHKGDCGTIGKKSQEKYSRAQFAELKQTIFFRSNTTHNAREIALY
jgi:hypothetical protein